jgi:hypothetical protein
MKKCLALFVAVAAYTVAFSQGPKFYVDNTLPISNASAQQIPYPFVGGFMSPQFSNIDLDGDGIKDLFVFDRGGNKVLTYVRKGTEWVYTPKYEARFPKMVSWALLADYNGDGKEDIFTCADPHFYGQTLSVYKNISANDVLQFELVEPELTCDQNISGLPEASIYWINDDISSIVDIDNDGDLDILSFDASGASITLYGNEAVEKGYPLDSLVYRVYDGCWGGFLESQTDRTITLGTECFFGRYYPKAGVHSGSTMLMIDMDDDADKDLILGDISYSKVSMLTNGKKDFNWPYDSISAYDTVFPRNTVAADIYTHPAGFYVDVDNDKVNDLLMAPNLAAGGKTLNQVWYYKNSGTNTKPVFTFTKNNFLQDQTIDFGAGAAPAFVDADGDGDLDMVVAHRGDYELTLNKADRMELFVNVGDKTNASYKLDGAGDYLGLLKDSIRDMKPTFGDLNGDGKTDMIIGESDGHLWYYQNNAAGNSLAFTSPVKNFMKIDVGTAAAPQIIDLDEDGLLDLVVGTGKGIINFFKNKGSKLVPQFDSMPTIDTLGKVYVTEYYIYYIRDNKGNIIDSTRNYDQAGGYATPFFADLDGNDSLELLVGSRGGKLWLFTDIKNNLNGAFTQNDSFVYQQIQNKYGAYSPGVRNVPAVAKLTDSTRGKPVIVLGNFRGGLNFLNAVIDSIPSNVGVREIFRDLNVNLFPNPTNGTLNISRSLQQYDGKLAVIMIDMMGRTVYNGTIEAGEARTAFSLAGMENGIYYLQITDRAEYQTVQKVTVLH